MENVFYMEKINKKFLEGPKTGDTLGRSKISTDIEYLTNINSNPRPAVVHLFQNAFYYKHYFIYY